MSNETDPPLTGTTLTCNDCLVTIWHSQYSQRGATFVSDVPGAVFTTANDNPVFRTPYSAFFDFGPSTRFRGRADAIQHHREAPLTLLRAVDTGVETLADVTGDVDLTSPGIFEIASSPILPIRFRIIVGSTTKIPAGFSNRVGSGVFAELAVVNGALSYIPPLSAPALLRPAVESTAFRALSWLIVAIMILVGLGGLVYFVTGVICHVRSAPAATAEAASDVAVDASLIA
jgi:hypothetical protein